MTMWGYLVHRTTLRHTPFVCARCGVDRVGSEIEPQRWFGLFGHRVLPLATHDRYIECDTCAHHCDVGALEIPTTEELARLLYEGTRHAVVSVVRASTPLAEDPSPKVVQAAIVAMRDAEQGYDELRLRRDLAKLPSGETSERLSLLVAELTPHGKQGFLRRISEITVADGPITEFERRAVHDIGMALGMAAPHINGVVAVAALQFETA